MAARNLAALSLFSNNRRSVSRIADCQIPSLLPVLRVRFLLTSLPSLLIIVSMSTEKLDGLRVAGEIHGQDVYARALEAAEKELATLRQERQKIDDRIVKLEHTVEGLFAVCEEQGIEVPAHLAKAAAFSGEDVSGLGLTNAVRKVLAAQKTPITPTQVRDALVKSGMDLSKYSNAMVAIHNTLKRLFDQGEVAKSKDEPTRYMWVNMMARMYREAVRMVDQSSPTIIPKDFVLR